MKCALFGFQIAEVRCQMSEINFDKKASYTFGHIAVASNCYNNRAAPPRSGFFRVGKPVNYK